MSELKCKERENKIHQCLMAVMAPLMLDDGQWDDFNRLLGEASSIGVEALTVDIWWGLVMKDRNKPDWEYYKKLFQMICNHDLDIIPIFSLHHGGGSVGDGNLNIPIPKWVYDELATEAGLESDDLRYLSEQGRYNIDALPVWATITQPHGTVVVNAVKDFFKAFTAEPFFKQMAQAGRFPEINISLGPAGELRYPSYNISEGWDFPHRGFFQCYGRLARQSFRKWAQEKYEKLLITDPSAAKKTWIAPYRGSGTNSYMGIRPPDGHLMSGNALADFFVRERDYLKEGYGQDFITWYHESLRQHGLTLLEAANDSFSDEPFKQLPFGMKIPGIHWQWRCTNVPRIAEITAGLIPATAGLISLKENENPAVSGYESIFSMVQKFVDTKKRSVFIHFTALEMDDDSLPWADANARNMTSRAQTLVKCVAKAASQFGIPLRGENALICVSSDDPDNNMTDWSKIKEAFEIDKGSGKGCNQGRFSGFTLLRLNSSCWEQEKNEFKKFIESYDTDRKLIPEVH